MMTKSIAERLTRSIAIADRLFAAARVDPFARLREFPFPALRQLPRIGDALTGYRLAAKPQQGKTVRRLTVSTLSAATFTATQDEPK
jgi:hypothetical protein